MHQKQGKIKAFFRLTRIEHSAMLVIAVLAAEVIASGGLPPASTTLLSFVAPIFISMGAFAVNDYFDIAVDRANKRFSRPLVSGAISPKSALAATFACFAIGVVSSALINAAAFLISIIFAVLAFLYSYKLKELPIIGNLYIAFTMAIPFFFGNYVVSYQMSTSILLISMTVLLSGFAREVHGTIRDYRGDRKIRNVKSIPYYIGVKGSATLAFAFYLSAISLSIWLFFLPGPFGGNLLYIAMIFLVDAMLVYVSAGYFVLKRGAEGRSFGRARNLSLFAMGLALLAYLLVALLSL